MDKQSVFLIGGFVISMWGIFSLVNEFMNIGSLSEDELNKKNIYINLLLWFGCILCGFLTMVAAVIIK